MNKYEYEINLNNNLNRIVKNEITNKYKNNIDNIYDFTNTQQFSETNIISFQHDHIPMKYKINSK